MATHTTHVCDSVSITRPATPAEEVALADLQVRANSRAREKRLEWARAALSDAEIALQDAPRGDERALRMAEDYVAEMRSALDRQLDD